MSLAKKIGKNKSKPTDKAIAKKVKEAYGKSAIMVANAQKKVKANYDRIYTIAKAYMVVYSSYVLKKTKASIREIERYQERMKDMEACVRGGWVSIGEMIGGIIRATTRNECKMPDYKAQPFDEDEIRAKELKRVNGDLNLAIYNCMCLKVLDLFRHELEVMAIVSLHDELGWGRVRIQRFVDEIRGLFKTDMNKFKEICKELVEKFKLTLDDDVKEIVHG